MPLIVKILQWYSAGMDPLIIFGAKYLIVISALAALWVVWRLPRKEQIRFTILAVISLPLALILAKVAGQFYVNERPFVVGNFVPLVPHGADNGFPSDHTLLSSALAMLVLLYRTRVGIMLWVIAAIVGLSRVAAGVHHFIDVLGAAAIAVLAVYGTHRLLQMRLPPFK